MALLAAGLLSACGPYVRSDYDAKANLANYRTFSWDQRRTEERRSRERAFANPINEKRLRDAVAAQLMQRGLQQAPAGTTGELLVSVAIGSRINERDAYYPRWSLGMGWGWPYRHYGTGILVEDDVLYRENRVSVDLFDAKSREPVWHAAITTDISNLTGDNAQTRIDEAVKSMFTKFPGAAGGGA